MKKEKNQGNKASIRLKSPDFRDASQKTDCQNPDMQGSHCFGRCSDPHSGETSVPTSAMRILHNLQLLYKTSYVNL